MRTTNRPDLTGTRAARLSGRRRAMVLGALVLASVAAVAATEWTVETIHVGTGPAGVGFYNALVLNPNTGAPVIAYSDNDRDDVLLAQWAAETGWTRQVVDAGRNVANGISVAYDESHVLAQPGISYGWGQLKLAEWNGSRWVVSVIDKNAFNDTTSLAYYNGQPAISYHGNSGKTIALRLARRSASGVWSIETVDKAGAGTYSSLVFDHTGQPSIAYSADPDGDNTINQLRFAQKKGDGTWTIQQLESGIGAGVSVGLAFHPLTFHPAIVHRTSPDSVRYLWWNGVEWQREAVAEGSSPSLAFDPIINEPVVTYAAPAYGDRLTLSRRTSIGWTAETIVAESAEVVNPHLRFASSSSLPYVSYRVGGSTRTLRFARAAGAP